MEFLDFRGRAQPFRTKISEWDAAVEFFDSRGARATFWAWIRGSEIRDSEIRDTEDTQNLKTA